MALREGDDGRLVGGHAGSQRRDDLEVAPEQLLKRLHAHAARRAAIGGGIAAFGQ
jgi:hypothetical protein